MRCSSECCEISPNCFDSSDGSPKQAHVIRRGDQPAVPLHRAHPAHQGGGAQAGGAAEQEQRGPGDRRSGAGAGGQEESRRTWGPVSARCGHNEKSLYLIYSEKFPMTAAFYVLKASKLSQSIINRPQKCIST